MKKKIVNDPKQLNPTVDLIFQQLKSGRAYTLIELSNSTQIGSEFIDYQLSNLVDKGIIQQRFIRKRHYYFINDEDFLTQLVSRFPKDGQEQNIPKGMKYCRHCYHHLAGFVGVKLIEKLIEDQRLILHSSFFEVTPSGWDWLAQFEIFSENYTLDMQNTKNCLDFSERKPHLDGRLGDALLRQMKAMEWLIQVPNSREIIVTEKGSRALKQQLHIDL